MLNEALYRTPDQPSQLRSLALSKLACGEPDRAEAALWQGVPVVSLTGRPSVGRFRAMILHAVGMDDWVTAHAYVARAVAAAGLARHVEAAYRALYDAC
jgi:hypothetical protein